MSITVDYFRNQPPKKHRGQNFMINDANLDFLSRIINRKKSNWLIEIGGGLGPLSNKIWRIGLMGETAKKENIQKLIDAFKNILQ